MISWRALLQNQWFQLCLLVALLSGGTTIYNVTRSIPIPPTPPSLPTPTPTAAPRPAIVKITPKKRGQWIVDASGAHDADSSDIATVAASLTDGDVVTLRPGTYTGSCEITVSARFVGPASGKGVASIRSVDPQHPGLSISGKKVSLENVSINFEAAGDWPAMWIWRNSIVEMANCSMSTQSKFGILAGENASFSAQSSDFRAPGGGCCLKYEGASRGSLNHCTFSAARWGLDAENGAQVQGSNCAFQKVGLLNGFGRTASAVGGRVSLALNACQFTDNAASIVADEGSTLRVTSSAFRNNGVTGEGGNTTLGVICTQTGAKTFLKDDTFEDNKQGLVAIKAGNLTLENVKMHHTGLITDNQTIKVFCNAICANDQGSTITASNCTIADSLIDGVLVAGGAHLKASASVIGNSTQDGLAVGLPNVGAAQAELDNVQFIANHGDAVWLNSASQLTMQNCQISQSGGSGIEAQDQGTAANITNMTITRCQGSGMNSHTGATISATGCTMESNSRGAQAGLVNDSSKAGTVALVNCVVQKNAIFGVGACRGAVLEMKGGFLGNNKQDAWQEPGGNVRLQR
jgi:hypothetical protein